MSGLPKADAPRGLCQQCNRPVVGYRVKNGVGWELRARKHSGYVQGDWKNPCPGSFKIIEEMKNGD